MLTKFLAAVEAAPKNATFLMNRAAAYIGDSRYQDALRDCQNALAIEPEHPKILNRIARIYTQTGQPDSAIEMFNYSASFATVPQEDRNKAQFMQDCIDRIEHALRNEPVGSYILHQLELAESGLGNGVSKPKKWVLLRGEAYLLMRDPNAMGSAQGIAIELLRQNGNDPEALVLRGRALYGMGDNGQALLHFQKALSCDPDYQDARKHLRMVQKLDRLKEEGNTHYKKGRNDRAVEAYTQALSVDPRNKYTNSKIFHNRALAYIKVLSYPKPGFKTVLS